MCQWETIRPSAARLSHWRVLYRLRRGQNTYTSTWLRGTSYCTWAGLTCGSGTQLTDLKLIGVGVGSWPSSVSSLSYLRSFNYEPFRKGNVSAVASLPLGLASWTSLTSLRIDCSRMQTCFSGALDAISSLPALQSLSLSGMTSVTAPSSWSLLVLTSLAVRNVAGLTGTLPAFPFFNRCTSTAPASRC
jgi:hypothetical protein